MDWIAVAEIFMAITTSAELAKAVVWFARGFYKTSFDIQDIGNITTFLRMFLFLFS